VTDEIWRDVVGFDYYQISSHGRVKSLARTVPVRGRQRQKRVRQRILRPDVRQRGGRRKVTLYNRHGEKLTVTVAQLMRQVGFPANIEPAPANFCGPEVTVTEPLPHVTAGGMVTERHGHRAFTQLKGMFCGGLQSLRGGSIRDPSSLV
jgi:NUMOD4 motif